MSIKRRKTTGKPLMLATAGLAVTACVGKEVTSGNLMPPQTIELCIEVEPENATVTVDGGPTPGTLADGECRDFYDGRVEIEATAEGYQDYSETIELYAPTLLEIEMIPDTAEDSGE